MAYLDSLNAAIATAEKTNPHLQGQLRLARHLAEARLWREAGETVEWLRSLTEARDYALGLRFAGYLLVVGAVLNSYLETGEGLQAMEYWEEAIEAYIAEKDLPGLSDFRRGEINLRLAECYVRE